MFPPGPCGGKGGEHGSSAVPDVTCQCLNPSPNCQGHIATPSSWFVSFPGYPDSSSGRRLVLDSTQDAGQPLAGPFHPPMSRLKFRPEDARECVIRRWPDVRCGTDLGRSMLVSGSKPDSVDQARGKACVFSGRCDTTLLSLRCDRLVDMESAAIMLASCWPLFVASRSTILSLKLESFCEYVIGDVEDQIASTASRP